MQGYKKIFNTIYDIVLVICKLLLVADICVVSLTVAGRYLPFIPSMTWTEEITLTLMSYMAVLSAALAIHRKAHIRMNVFDRYMSQGLLNTLDVISDIAVMGLAIVMVVIGWSFANGLGSKGFYSSLPWLSKRWMYYPIPLAGVAMIFFQIEALLDDFFMITGKKGE